MEARCTVEMLGGLKVRMSSRVTNRFRTQKTGALLAYLAYFRERVHPRETLIALLWPDAPPESGRNSLSQALSALRSLLEPPGIASGATVIADRFNVGLNPQATRTDVGAFEAALTRANGARDSNDQYALLLEQALALWHGPLLPGFYEPWIPGEQARLAGVFQTAAVTLARLYEAENKLDDTIAVLRRALQVSSAREETYRDIIRLLLRTGQNGAAVRELRELRRILAETGEEISLQTKQLFIPLRVSGFDVEAALAVTPSKSRPLKHKIETSASLPADSSMAPPVSATNEPNSFWAQDARLPLSLSSFFGRAAECEQLMTVLTQPRTRLVTITGPGGNGKTRLALEVARELSHREPFADRVFFAPLADIDTAASLPGAIAEAFGLARSATESSDPWESLARILSEQASALLVLDNFEQIAQAGAEQVQTLLRRVPNVSCLVTSRVRLHSEGEREFVLSPLPFPTQARETESPAALLKAFPSVALFVDRAQQARPDFQITPRNAPAVVELVNRLEGIPLSLELAAARANVLTPRDMLARLDRRFDLLRVSERTRRFPERHRSLWAAVAWSFRLLSPEVQAFFSRLFVFRGGFTAEAAESVTGEVLALDHLAVLRDASLLTARENEEGTLRLFLLETLREFAEEQGTKTERIAAQEAHAHYFANLADEADAHLAEDDRREWLDLLDVEHDNLFAGLHFFAEADASSRDERHARGLQMFIALDGFWRQRSFVGAARRVGTMLLARAGEGVPVALRAKGWGYAGTLALHQGDVAIAHTYFQTSLALWETTNNEGGRQYALNGIGRTYLNQNRYAEAEAVFRELLEKRRAAGDVLPITFSLNNLGIALFFQHRFSEARACFEEMIALNRQEGNTLGIAVGQSNLGDVALVINHWEEAEACFTEALTLTKLLGTRSSYTVAERQMGWLRLRQNRVDEAHTLITQSLRTANEFGQKSEIALRLGSLACVFAAQNQPAKAARLWGAADALREREHLTQDALYMPGSDVFQASARVTLGKNFDREWTVGRALSLSDAIALALDTGQGYQINSEEPPST